MGTPGADGKTGALLTTSMPGICHPLKLETLYVCAFQGSPHSQKGFVPDSAVHRVKVGEPCTDAIGNSSSAQMRDQTSLHILNLDRRQHRSHKKITWKVQLEMFQILPFHLTAGPEVPLRRSGRARKLPDWITTCLHKS